MTFRAAPAPDDALSAPRTGRRSSPESCPAPLPSLGRRRLLRALPAAALAPAVPVAGGVPLASAIAGGGLAPATGSVAGGAAAAAALGPRAARAAEGIEVQRASLELSVEGDAWVLSADFVVPLPPRLEEAVNRGVPLYFVVEFALVRPRWWWFDERTAEASQTWRLAYHALTRQYRLSLSGLSQPFDTLAEAVAALSRVRGWRVVERERVRAGSHEASVRMRLDLSQLPKPFQVSAITERDWNLQSEWKRFPFNPETTRSAP